VDTLSDPLWGSAGEFRRHFRLTRELFDTILARLALPERTCMDGSPGLSPLVRFAAAILRLASGESYRAIGRQLGIADSSVSDAIAEVCQRLVDVRDTYVRWPSTADDRKLAAEAFAPDGIGLNRCIGAIDGSLIPVQIGTLDPVSYISRKKRMSIQLQAVVNNGGIFTDVFVGFPGSVHDARVLSNSELKGQNVPLPYYLIGDGGYPLRSWLLTPYRGVPTPGEKRFNKHLSSKRVTVERAFGRLKARWRTTQHVVAQDHRAAVNMIVAACVLHNIAEIADPWEEWIEEDHDADAIPEVHEEADGVAADAERIRLEIAMSLE